MNRASLVVCGIGCWIAAIVVGHARPARAGEWAAALARPLAVPFLWRTVEQAARSGSPAEVFAKARLLLESLPAWADGYTVFAWRYALDGGDGSEGRAEPATASKLRLQASLALLETARQRCPADEVDLLVSMAFLVELAARREPGLAALLAADPGAGEPVVLADRFLAAAERLDGGGTVREQRIFQAPRLCAALLRGGDRNQALAVLDATIARCGEVRDVDLGQQWAQALRLVRRRLLGDRAVELGPVADDPRFEPLRPFLR